VCVCVCVCVSDPLHFSGCLQNTENCRPCKFMRTVVIFVRRDVCLKSVRLVDKAHEDVCMFVFVHVS
jgi:hypothetical protein